MVDLLGCANISLELNQQFPKAQRYLLIGGHNNPIRPQTQHALLPATLDDCRVSPDLSTSAQETCAGFKVSQNN